MTSLRTTIYLADAAAEVVERVKTAYRGYGIAVNLSSVFARLLLGESIDDVVQRPFRADLLRIAGERDGLRAELRSARARRRTSDVHRIHAEVAQLYPRLKQIQNTLGRAKRRNAPLSPDFAEAHRIEENLDELMTECVDAIMAGRRG